MAITFPTSPIDGQEYIAYGRSYYYNSTLGVWRTTVSSITTPISTQVTAYDSVNDLPADGEVTGTIVYIKNIDAIYAWEVDTWVQVSGSGGGFSGDYTDLVNTPTLATVATSGDYTDLINTPTIPEDVSDLTDTTSLLSSGGGSSVISYSLVSQLPGSGNEVGDLAIVTENDFMYFWNGSGWFKIMRFNEIPAITLDAPIYLHFTPGSSAVTVNFVVDDPETQTITYANSLAVTTDTGGNGDAGLTKIGSENSVQLSIDAAYSNFGEASLTLTANDGENVVSRDTFITCGEPYQQFGQSTNAYDQLPAWFSFDTQYSLKNDTYTPASGFGIPESYNNTSSISDITGNVATGATQIDMSGNAIQISPFTFFSAPADYPNFSSKGFFDQADSTATKVLAIADLDSYDQQVPEEFTLIVQEYGGTSWSTATSYCPIHFYDRQEYNLSKLRGNAGIYGGMPSQYMICPWYINNGSIGLSSRRSIGSDYSSTPGEDGYDTNGEITYGNLPTWQSSFFIRTFALKAYNDNGTRKWQFYFNGQPLGTAVSDTNIGQNEMHYYEGGGYGASPSLWYLNHLKYRNGRCMHASGYTSALSDSTIENIHNFLMNKVI